MARVIKREKRTGRISGQITIDPRITKQLNDAIRNTSLHSRVSFDSIKPVAIEKKIVNRREEIENQGLEQDIKKKKWSLIVLFIFLAVETAAIFLFTFFQAIQWRGFELKEWSFRLLIAATITQITLMLQVAIKHLFPQQKN